MILNNKQQLLLYEIINNNKCFDRRDNTFKLSNRQIAEQVNVSASKVDQLFRVLNKHYLVKKMQTTTHNTVKGCRMLSPRFIFISYTPTDKYFYSAMFDLGCPLLADVWRKDCRKINGLICPNTGEIDIDFNWYYIDQKAASYSCFDKTYRKGITTVSTKAHKESSQGFSMSDSSFEKPRKEDLEWFKAVNKESIYTYPENLSMSSSRRFNSMYEVLIW